MGKTDGKFNTIKTNIVNFKNIEGDSEIFNITHNGQQYFTQPLSSCVSCNSVDEIESIWATVRFFQRMDDLFITYLGIGNCPTEEGAIKEIQRLLNKERDGRHKYYIIKEQLGQPIGLLYIYEYHEKYKHCNLAIGILPEYRGKGLSARIITDLCDILLSQGIIRIGLEIETTNESSLKCFEKLCTTLGFKKEGTLRNLYGVGIDSIVYSLIKEPKSTIL